MANLRTNNLSGEQGQNAYRGSVFFSRGTASAQSDSLEFSGIAIGTSDFTIEGWLYKTKTGDYPVIFDTRESGNADSGGFFFGTDSSNYLYFYTQSTNAIKQTIISNFSWYHFALVKTGGTTTLYLNGQVSGTYSDSNNYSNDITKLGTSQQYTGGVQNNWNWGGYLSNIRIVVGSAVYTSAFTPPTSELKAIPNTKLLCCQNSDDPTQEETGRSITANGMTSLVNRTDNLIKNGRFTASATENWTLSGGTAALGTGQSGSFGDGNHVVLTATSSYAYLKQSFTTVIGRTYRTDGQSNGGDASFISTSTNENDAVITDIRGGKTFIATQTTHHVILRGNTGGANFDTISVHENENRVQPKVIPPFGVDAGNTFGGPIQQSSQGYMYFPTGRTEERGRGRGIIAGGYNGPSSFSYNAALSEVEIASDGVTSKFGDLTQARYTVATVGSSTRSVFIGGGAPVSPNPFFSVNTIDFVTIATKGNAQDFGYSDEVGYFKTGVSSSTRGVYTQGRIYNPSAGTGSNALEFITIATTGNGQDFGDLVGGGRVTLTNTAMSPTRGILAGGVASPVGDPTTFVNTIEFVTMASLGNSVNFGDLQKSGGRSNGNCSSSTRGVFNIGTQSPADGNTIEFVTIATTGDAIDFGDLSGGMQMRGACSNKTRGLFAGGFVAPGSANYVNTCEKITIATTGNATDWGDVFEGSNRAYNSGISDSHGGLS